jgi:hypothetical protein
MSAPVKVVVSHYRVCPEYTKELADACLGCEPAGDQRP